jgi:hypothetical protein
MQPAFEKDDGQRDHGEERADNTEGRGGDKAKERSDNNPDCNQEEHVGDLGERKKPGEEIAKEYEQTQEEYSYRGIHCVCVDPTGKYMFLIKILPKWDTAMKKGRPGIFFSPDA